MENRLPLGPVAAVIGAQWGDEGKGKIIDLLAEQFDVLARASGGANAGHTIVVNEPASRSPAPESGVQSVRGEGWKKHIFHLIPSGCLHPAKPIVLGNGMVIHLPTLLKEITVLCDAGVDVMSRLHISEAAHIVLEYHKEIDGVLEDRLAGKSGAGIGTTKRGIGPTYADKAYRTGLRMGDLKDRSLNELRGMLEDRAPLIAKMFDITVNIDEELAHLNEAKTLLEKTVEDTVTFLHDKLARGKTILIEGAQATHLDIDHGTYPYVTSSQTTVMGALQGLGLPPRVLTSVIGVAKAYCTRVGGGPFPTEVTGTRGDALRERGDEYGATTGRPRRCGWLSLSDLKRSAQLNGFTHLNITKLDVLDAEEEIPVFSDIETQNLASLRGWKTSTKGITSFNDLPKNAQTYITYIEKSIGVPVSFIGTGPEREAMIVR